MNTLVIVLIAAVLLVTAYALYGRWLAKNGELIPKRKPPQLRMKTVRIMFRQTVGVYSVTSSHPLPEQAP